MTKIKLSTLLQVKAIMSKRINNVYANVQRSLLINSRRYSLGLCVCVCLSGLGLNRVL